MDWNLHGQSIDAVQYVPARLLLDSPEDDAVGHPLRSKPSAFLRMTCVFDAVAHSVDATSTALYAPICADRLPSVDAF